MQWHDDIENDTCDHYRAKFLAEIEGIPNAMVKIELDDEGEREIHVGCFVNQICIGELKGRFWDVPSQFGCRAFSDLGQDSAFHLCECMAIPIPEKNISHPDISGVTGNILHIEYIEVEPQYRRKGVGRVLASIAAREAERVGVKHILLSPMDIGGGESKATAESFWEALGYMRMRSSPWFDLPIPAVHAQR